ncbi:hypothetical protein [Polymorphobacter megasporae]|uniref:hypothetical protein n=1 Tax=Glacieibacterium megasporae TaxID=2835787 RepID=UPI001C1E67A8|nr:hypothetical protein [Polymorphobacter megasporae]UAJ09937.1 hypothetical protein KTC28_16855 [Polymorphobacter megasporae]
MTRFVDTKVCRSGRYSLGRDGTGSYYLSIPLANPRIDYEEYYRLDSDEFARFFELDRLAEAFAEECRQRRHDDRLILPPGSDRGTAQ